MNRIGTGRIRFISCNVTFTYISSLPRTKGFFIIECQPCIPFQFRHIRDLLHIRVIIYMLLLPRTRTSPTEITGKCSLEISEAKHHFTSKLCSQRENVTFVLRCPYPLVTIFGKPQNLIVNMHQITGCFCIQCHPGGQIILITDGCVIRIAVFGFHIGISTGTPIKIVHTGKTVII